MKRLKVRLVEEESPVYVPEKINSSLHSADMLRNIYGEDAEEWHLREYGYLVCLSRSLKPTSYRRLSQGNSVGTIMCTRDIIYFALASAATGIIIAHNHPSGNLTPSSQDRGVTLKIKAACDAVDLLLVDHIILTREGHFSFQDEGLL